MQKNRAEQQAGWRSTPLRPLFFTPGSFYCPEYRLSRAQTPLNSPHRAGGGNSPNGPERPLWGVYGPLLKAGGGQAILNKRKKQSINALAGAIAEAESQLYSEEGTDLNGLRALLKGFLYSARHHRCGRGCGGSCSEKAPLQRGESSRRHDRND